jgi:quercetin dioxygenase-like cupin family protein
VSKPVSIETGVVFELGAAADELRRDPVYERTGHVARTLVRVPDLRVVLIVLAAGSHVAEHAADETASVHLLSGKVRLALPDREVELRPGQLLVLDAGLAHDVTAVADSTFLLTLAWHGDTGSSA